MSAPGKKDFFRPLWVRALIVGLAGGWAVVEWLNGESGWALLAAAVTAYGVWSFLIGYKPGGTDDGAGGGNGKE